MSSRRKNWSVIYSDKVEEAMRAAGVSLDDFYWISEILRIYSRLRVKEDVCRISLFGLNLSFVRNFETGEIILSNDMTEA